MILLAGAWVLGPVPAALAADLDPEGWEFFESTSFQMLGNGDAELSAEILLDLELFRRAFEQLAPGIDASFPIPTRIIGFRDADAYGPFKTATDTAKTKILGQFLGHRDGNFITLNLDPRLSGGLGIIIHEYVHHILNQNLPRVPRWLNEGLAEYYSTFSVEADYAVVGRPVERHMSWWRRNRELSVLDVLRENAETPTHSLRNAGQFYAVSWGLAHYLMSTPGGLGVLASYLEEVTVGADSADALLNASNLSVRELEGALRRHVAAEIMPAASLALAELGEVEIERGASPPDSILTALGELAARLGNGRHAEELFNLAFAYDPTNAEAIAGLAGLRDDQARAEEASVLYADAFAAGPRSAGTFLRHGRHLLRRIEANRMLEREASQRLAIEAKTSFLAAMALDPSFAETYAMLALVHLFDGLEAEDGLGFGERARELLPTRADVVHTLIRLHLKLGAIDRANRLVDGSFRLLADRESQARVRDEVRRAELLIAAREALAEGRWDDGLSYFDQAITYTGDAEVRLQMEAQLEVLARQADRERRPTGGVRR